MYDYSIQTFSVKSRTFTVRIRSTFTETSRKSKEKGNQGLKCLTKQIIGRVKAFKAHEF